MHWSQSSCDPCASTGAEPVIHNAYITPKFPVFGKIPTHIVPNHVGLLLLPWGHGNLASDLGVVERLRLSSLTVCRAENNGEMTHQMISRKETIEECTEQLLADKFGKDIVDLARQNHKLTNRQWRWQAQTVNNRKTKMQKTDEA